MIEQSEQGFWYIKNDTHVSKWCMETKTLCHDQFACDFLREYISPGMKVIEGGANIGSICRLFLDCGASVIAYEPGYEMYQCLIRNCPKATCHHLALSDAYYEDLMLVTTPNAGASFMADRPTEGFPFERVMCNSLDNLLPDYHVDFIKLDCEGAEKKILDGAKKLIDKEHPILYLEVNSSALQRQGNTKEELFELLKEYGYQFKIAQENCKWEDPQYDVLATYKGE